MDVRRDTPGFYSSFVAHLLMQWAARIPYPVLVVDQVLMTEQ
jgi:hypothetical protein